MSNTSKPIEEEEEEVEEEEENVDEQYEDEQYDGDEEYADEQYGDEEYVDDHYGDEEYIDEQYLDSLDLHLDLESDEEIEDEKNQPMAGPRYAKEDDITKKLAQLSSELIDLEFGVINITNNIKRLDINIDQALLEAGIWHLHVLEQEFTAQNLEVEEDTEDNENF